MQDAQNKVALVKSGDARQGVAQATEKLGGVDRLARRFAAVLIKPNLCGGVAGEPGSHTSAAVLEPVLELFSTCGRPLYIGEADGSFNDADHMFRALGIHDLARRFGARVVNLSRGPYVDVDVPQPNSIRVLRVAALLRESLIVSVPVLKTHPWTGITISMKNMYGAVYEPEKARFHNGLDKNIVDINKVIGAHLSIVDATVAVVQGGFKQALWVGCPPTRLDLILAGLNPVAVDAVGARVLGRDPRSIGYIELAGRQGLGTCAVRELEVVGSGYELPAA